MAVYYTYLIASLPMLQFGERLPFSFEQFVERCRGLIPDGDIILLKTALQPAGQYYEGGRLTLRRWRLFDITLRNELVKIRAGRKKIDPLKYQRLDGYISPYITHIALNASRNPSILEAERMLDFERWRFLDELCIGHYFDIDFLIVYAYKLSILEKWERIHRADTPELLERTIERKSS